MVFDVYCLFHVICFVSATVPFSYLLLFSSYCIWVYNLHIEQDSRGGVVTPILQTYLDICKVHIEHYSRARVMTKALHIDFDYVRCTVYIITVYIYIYEQYSRATFSILLFLSGDLYGISTVSMEISRDLSVKIPRDLQISASGDLQKESPGISWDV